MGQFERWVVGVVITLFAYRFMEQSSQRIYFHKLATQVLSCLKLSQCYCLIQSLRIGVSAILISGGLALLFDASICMAVTAQLLFFSLEALKLRCCSCLGIYQNVFIHLLLLAVLMNNLKERSQERKRQKQQKKKQKQAEAIVRPNQPSKPSESSRFEKKAQTEPLYPKRKR